jgi:3'(2'), 5'-bisphosphate nucleotidase
MKDIVDSTGLVKNILLAGEEILRVYNGSVAVEYKADHSPLTIADKRSNNIITGFLASSSPLPILSEEAAEVNYSERKNWNRFWLLDPLDGTKEFINRNGEFTINIALIENSAPVFGLIYLPVKDLLYAAIKGKGSFRILNLKNANSSDFDSIIYKGEKLPFPKDASRPYTVITSRSHINSETEGYIDEKRKKYPLLVTMPAGSALKFCLVAEGKADVYPRFGLTMEWDTAAGQLIAEEAGKKVICPDTGMSLSYNKPDMHNPFFIVE